MTNQKSVWQDVSDKPPEYTQVVLTDGIDEIDAYFGVRYTIGGFRANIEKYNKWRLKISEEVEH